MQGSTVLVVDDDPSIRELLAGFLEDEGYTPELVSDGAEAIASLGSPAGPPDAMLLDLMMPGTDGYSVLEHLRQNLLQEFPVLIFSAKRPDDAILKALDTELRDFIAKPFELDELSIRLKRLLQRSPRFAPVSEKSCLRIYTLGSLRVYRDDSLLFNESWRNKPSKTIFKLLFTHAGQRYPKDVLAEELWPETPPQVATNRLRVAIHELRKMLDGKSSQSRAENPITQQEGTYFFDPAIPCWSDAHTFENFVDQAREFTEQGDIDEALHSYKQAEALYLGDYLRDDPFFEWTVATRERLREVHLSMLSDVAKLHAEHNEPNEAASFCRKILRIEPWREEVYRHIMEYLVAAGRPNEALRAFEECRRVLKAEIDAEPSTETRQLRDRVAAASRQASTTAS